jgi:VWFA-related protein
MKRKFLIAVLICQLALSALAQQTVPQKQASPPQADPQQASRDDDVVKITTNLVQVDPVITDKDGKVVTDLRSDEVEIFEDGKPQKITHFSFVPLESSERPTDNVAIRPVDKNAPPVPSPRLRPEDVRRTIAVVVDDLGLNNEGIYFVRKALKKFLDQQMQPGDLVAIIRTGGGIGALQQFTSDKRQLYAALERVKFNPFSRAVGDFNPLSPDPMATTGKGMSDANDVDRERGDDLDQVREDLFAVGTLGAVNYVVRGLQTLPGRKSVVLMSGGLTLFRINNTTQNSRVSDAVARLIDLANRASVVIYTIDARGLETLNLTAADSNIHIDQVGALLSGLRGNSFAKQEGLKELADATGGIAFLNSNDLAGGIRRALDDQRGYYLIGYRPDESTFEQARGRRLFHHVTLRVKRPGKFTVRMRNGFFGVPEEQRAVATLTPRDLLMAALTSPFGSSGVNLRLTSLFFNDPKLGSTMRSLLYIKASDLTFSDQPGGWHQSVVDLVATTFGDNGILVDQLSQTHTLRLRDKAYENALKNGITYSINIPIKKAGAYQLRTALRDVGSNRVGSASQFVEVPDINKKRLTLSGLISRGVDPNAYQHASAGAGSDAADANYEVTDPHSNAALRQFKLGMVVEYGLAIYNAQVDRATGKPQLQTQVRLFRDGQPVFVGKEVLLDVSNQPDLRRLATNGAVQLASEMEPGEYVLQLVVTDLLRKDRYRVATQWLDFEVVK